MELRLNEWKEKALAFIRDCIFDINKELPDLTDTDIAEMLGIHKNQVSYIRNNKDSRLSPENMQRILDILNNRLWKTKSIKKS